MSYKNQIKTDNEDINMFHVDVLDGVRAIAVLVVVWFHIWQQSWLMPILQKKSCPYFTVVSFLHYSSAYF